jgi:hypothetical protein
MNQQDEQELAQKIAARLDESAAGIRQGAAYRLQTARQAALARMANGADTPLRAAAPELSAAGMAGGTMGRSRHWYTDYRLWLAVLVVAGGLYVYDYWATLKEASDIAEVDSALLAGDLPFDAFLDKGFENWLNRNRD